MYDLLLVRRRRLRKVAAFVSLVSSIGVGSLVTVSFLGQYTGTFTVTISNSSVRLSISEKESFEDPTSYLRIDQLNDFEEYTYELLPKDLDDENKDYTYGVATNTLLNKDVLRFFKYTFYVGNLGGKVAQYNLKINILERTKSTDGTNRTLDDTARIMVFENDVDDATGTGIHTTEIFAKESATNHLDKDGNPTRREFVSKQAVQEDDEHPLATTFESYSTVKTYKRGAFYSGQKRRYTIVMWSEGEDPQSTTDSDIPVGASLKLGVEITAYENE